MIAAPEVFQLAGHPVRWQLLGELAGSDRTVQELTARVGEAQNLVSYHLGKLRDAELVSSRRSSADGRDVYYAADLTRLGALLSDAAGGLHPALRATPGGVDPQGLPAGRVLFLCTGNSARSQIAEALLRLRSGGRVEAHSAGSQPKPLHPSAVRVLRELGADPAVHVPKHLAGFVDQRFDWVISLCDKVREVCPDLPGHPEKVHWSLPDPSAITGARASRAAFRALTDELDLRIGFLLAALADTDP